MFVGFSVWKESYHHLTVDVLQFSHLIQIQRRLGSEQFPLVQQSFYPNHREMSSNLWVFTNMVLFAGNTVWSMWSISERVIGVCVDVLYKSTYTLLYFTLSHYHYMVTPWGNKGVAWRNQKSIKNKHLTCLFLLYKDSGARTLILNVKQWWISES